MATRNSVPEQLVRLRTVYSVTILQSDERHRAKLCQEKAIAWPSQHPMSPITIQTEISRLQRLVVALKGNLEARIQSIYLRKNCELNESHSGPGQEQKRNRMTKRMRAYPPLHPHHLTKTRNPRRSRLIVI